MGQSWLIVDLDGKRTIAGGKLGEWFWESGWEVLQAFRIPARDPKIDDLLQGTIADQLASALLCLSQELYDLVLDELDIVDYMALLSCAVTCKTALVRSRRHIEIHQRRCASAFAGHRVICVGEYVDSPSELPPAMLTEEEVQQLRDFGESDDCPASLWIYALEHFDNGFRYYPDETIKWLERYGPYDVLRHWPPLDWDLVTKVGTPHYPSDRPRALCNLTKREYVNEDAASQICESLPTSDYGPRNSPEVWHFLLASICWSPDSSYSMAYPKDDLAKGRWAGDRLAIVTLDDLPQGEGSWKDVTEEVGALVKRIWAAECGDFSDTE